MQADIHGAIDAFLSHSAVERGLAPKTIEAYASDLARFASWLEDPGIAAPGSLRREHVIGFAQALEAEGLSARSRTRILIATRRWIRFLLATGELAIDPMEGIVTPRRRCSRRRLPTPPSVCGIAQCSRCSTAPVSG